MIPINPAYWCVGMLAGLGAIGVLIEIVVDDGWRKNTGIMGALLIIAAILLGER